MKHLKRYNEDIELDFEDEEFEEFNDDLDYPIILDKLTENEYKELLNKLNVGDRFEFSFKKKGTIRYIKNYFIGIEFDENIKGHRGGDKFRGKSGHCWFFSYYETYNLKINKRVL